jgi:hypothetical protein
MKPFRLVVLESPYKADTPVLLTRNVRYARFCMRDCFKRGEAPFASHLLYTQSHILNDSDPEERKWGIEAGLAWAMGAEATVVYTDLCITDGMMRGILHAERAKRPVEKRTLLNWENRL